MKDIKLIFVATIIFLILRVAFDIFGELTLIVLSKYPFLKSFFNIVILVQVVYLIASYLYLKIKKNADTQSES